MTDFTNQSTKTYAPKFYLNPTEIVVYKIFMSINTIIYSYPPPSQIRLLYLNIMNFESSQVFVFGSVSKLNDDNHSYVYISFV